MNGERNQQQPQQTQLHGGSPGRHRQPDGAATSEAEFTSYYGRPVVKEAPWEIDIPIYLFTGGLAAGSALLAAGGDLTGRPALRRIGRFASAGALSASVAALVHDLGRPSRFLHMLRVVRLTSPMSVGSWLLTLHGSVAGTATLAEIAGMLPTRARRGPVRLLGHLDRGLGVVSALTAPPLAAYTAVLLSDTATPSWHTAYEELPFVFVGSAATASGGLMMIGAPPGQTGPARAVAAGGAALELVAEKRMERSMGIAAEPLHKGTAGRWMRASKILTAAGAVGSLLAGKNRLVSALSGAVLMVGSACTRFGIFEAGQASARDPKYTVVPQRERLDEGQPVRYQP